MRDEYLGVLYELFRMLHDPTLASVNPRERVIPELGEQVRLGIRHVRMCRLQRMHYFEMTEHVLRLPDVLFDGPGVLQPRPLPDAVSKNISG